MSESDESNSKTIEERGPARAEMPASKVIELYQLFEGRGIETWLDGGWAVDALLGEQTRTHQDLDIAVEVRHVPTLRKILDKEGYRDLPRDDTSTWNFVLADNSGHEVDIHAFGFDDDGNGVLGPVENGDIYPADSLDGQGTINSTSVKCITAEWLIKFHTGYELSDSDHHDVNALCERFGIELPDEYGEGR